MSESKVSEAPSAASHAFDDAVALERVAGRLRGHTHDAYGNMVSPFGGLTAAVALNGLLLQSERFGDPVSLTVNFVAPIQRGEFFVEPRLIRSGRSTQHWSVQIVQNDEVTTSAIAFFGTRRPTWSLTEAVPPETPGPEEAVRFKPPRDLMRWPDMYDIRYARGQLRADNPDSVTHNWISDAQPRALDYLSLTAYCDTFVPRLLFRRPLFVPLGTVSLNIYFHVDAAELAAHGAEPVLGVAYGQVFHKGYFDQQAQVWGRDGRLLATTQQVVWFKE
jgi:acyl-CoA thioesterase